MPSSDNSIQALDASISSMVFIGAAVLFLLNWENRIKRNRALAAIHELRALAHIIDMHQLPKDPDQFTGKMVLTPSSPVPAMKQVQPSSHIAATNRAARWARDRLTSGSPTCGSA